MIALTKSTTLVVFIDKVYGSAHDDICFFDHYFKLRDSCELSDVDNIIDGLGHTDDEIDYFLVM